MSHAPRRSWKQVFRRWALFLVVYYLVVCLLMWLIENRLVFFPTPAEQFWEKAPDVAIQDVTLTSPNGTKIHAWYLPRKPDDPVIVLCSGNGANLSGRGQTLLRMRDRLGMSAMVFDYPGYGKSEGKPNEKNCYDAGEAVIRWLRDDQKIAPERIVLYGESLGGGVATELATRYPFRGLVLVKTFTSLPATAKKHYPWLPVYWLMSNRFDTLSKLPSVRCPVFVAGATADRVVPFDQSVTNFRAANEPKHFFRNEGSDHNDPLPDSFWDELRAFLERFV